MSATYEYPIRTDVALTVTYPKSGPAADYAQLHAAGCSHALRAQVREPQEFAGDDAYFSDDFFMVAPCAKAKRGGRVA